MAPANNGQISGQADSPDVMTDSVIVAISVLDVQPLRKGRQLAVATVELALDGVAFTIHGLRVLSVEDPVTGAAATAVDLPRYRDAAGTWRLAIGLPPELAQPIGDAVLARCCELGLTKSADLVLP